MQAFRSDIQVLRAVAVLSVFAFHFDVPGMPKGYLGVDIFFVISGYLMAQAIASELDAGCFHAGRFYLRRARRLLPAAWAMLLVATMAAPFVLTTHLLKDYAAQLAGALSFSANIVLWRQSGYFDTQAALKPLLHTWSLGLEEQYYLVLPALLWLSGKRWRGLTLSACLMASLAGCLWWRGKDPSGTFYLLPTRAWELLAGSVCALAARRGLPPQARVGLSRVRGLLGAPLRRLATTAPDSAWFALPAMALMLVKGIDSIHPRGDALLACAATGLLLLRPSCALNSSRAWLRPLHWIGDRSYSFYLVHWPVIAMAKNVWIAGVPATAKALLALLSVLLAHLSYTHVETPWRREKTPWRLLKRTPSLLGPLAAACALVWLTIQAPARGKDWSQAMRPNHGFSPACEFDRDFSPRPACRSTEHPRTFVWGDSFAMHLIPALQASAPEGGLQQATRSACSPVLDVARQLPGDPADKASRCLSFNRSVLAYLTHAPEIEYVVLSSRWQYHLTDPLVNARGEPVHAGPHELARSIADTIAQLRALGKKVIIVAPPPSLGPEVDLGQCATRHALGLVTVLPSLDADCSFAKDLFRSRQADVLAVLDEVALSADVHVIHLDDYTCPHDRCSALIEGATPLYRDFGHLSEEGARLLGGRVDFAGLIQTHAR